MESTGSRELIKSILIMAGIPLAFSLIARITNRKVSSFQDQIQETESERNHLKDQILVLKTKIEELQELEREIEDRFFRFINLKNQEYALMEVQNNLVIEKERAEFLEREVSSMEVETKKFDEMMIEYLKALQELEASKAENGLLQRTVKKLFKKTRESSRLMREKKLKMEAQEAEMLRTQVELKIKESAIEEFEREIDEMRTMIDQLRGENKDVLNKLETAETTISSKAEAERILMDNYNRVVNELEQLKKDRAAEVKELIYLRWCHACLRHELARRNQLEQERKTDNEKNDELIIFGRNVATEECIRHESDNENVTHNEEPFFEHNQRQPKRRWLLRKFKKWVDGNEKHHETKCFGSQSVVDETEQHSAGRKSFSSV
ncbi:hypothetical protein L2E82_35798 [Cichorium intybus]|uniref:Uncharacterized protein n=1 Tax=Cichorium intybus TaxID=13427 RepID=A0ACB9BPX9_CICIN|nr:hypothetical protein L2E82_35798 [Cichorium intybus]